MKFFTTLLITLSHGLLSAFAIEYSANRTSVSETEVSSPLVDLISVTSKKSFTAVTSSFLASSAVNKPCYYTTTCDEEGTTVVKTVECPETSKPFTSILSSEAPQTFTPSATSSCYFTTTCDEEGTPVTKIIECPQTSGAPIPSSEASASKIPIISSKVSHTSPTSACYLTTTCDEEGTPVTKIIECPQTSEIPVPSSKALTSETPIISSTALTTEIPTPSPKISTSEILVTSSEILTSEIPTPSPKVSASEILITSSEILITSSEILTSEIPTSSPKAPTTQMPIPSPLFPIPANSTMTVLPSTALTQTLITQNQTHSIITFEGVANVNFKNINVYIFGLLPLLLI